MNLYRSAEWSAFRRQVILLDGGACNRCGVLESSGAVLQVHHKQYFAGRLPWQYPFQLCEALCKGCHAAEHDILPPRSGWEFIGCDDLDDLSGSCEYCGESIRHVYMVQHPAWGVMEVGTDCCDNLTGTTEASAYRAKQQRINNRRKTFVSSPRWYTDSPPFHTINHKTAAGRKVQITVMPFAGGHALSIEGKVGKRVFRSIIEAKAAAFDACEFGELDAWLTRSRRARL